MSNEQALPGVLHALEPVLDRYGYLAVGGLILLEDFGVPVPGETILVLAAVYAGTGRLDLALVFALAVFGAVVGDNLGFLIGHLGGRRLADRFGRYVFLTTARLERATGFFDRYGGKVVVAARFIDGLRQANGIIAGTTRMPWQRFLVANALGAFLWVGVWVSVGYFSGDHIDAIYRSATRYNAYLGIALAVLAGGVVLRHVVRRQHP